MKILLGVTGSIAAKLTRELCAALHQHTVRVVATEKSLCFYRADELPLEVIRDKDEWFYAGVGGVNHQFTAGPILHIELRNWADVAVIAPLTANTLAKLACGLADNLLTSTLRAWDLSKPVVIAPAMNTQMWDSPFTQEHLQKLQSVFPKLTIVNPVCKTLACGERGMGAMAPIAEIVAATEAAVLGGK